ncbi:MAG: glutamine amidotransferase [Kofleriaceae bacterium]
MRFVLLTTGSRAALLALAVALALLALGLVRRQRPSAAVLAGASAVLALAVVVVEAMIAWSLGWWAPSGATFNEYRWVLLSPWGRFAVAAAALTVLAIIGLAWRSTRGAPPWRRVAMIALRGGAAATALVLFLEPAIELRQVAREPNRIALLVDASRSMGLTDVPGGPTRLARTQALLAASADTLAAWQATHRLDYYTFADGVVASSADGVARATAIGDATLMREALEEVRRRYDGRDLAGIVLVSDGGATGGLDSRDGSVRDVLRALEARVHTVAAARPGLRDVAIADVVADDFAFVRTVARIEAVVRASGYAGEPLTVTLSSDGRPIREQRVVVPSSGEVRVVFEVTPPRVGRYVYELATPVRPGEAIATNNARPFVVRVIRDKIRVLQVAGQPSWDVRALRELLEANPNVDLISFFILRTQDDVALVPSDEMSLIPFPTRELFEEELPSFDVIVLQNFEYLPYGIGDYLEDLRRYTAGGGGLVMLGGEQSLASGGYQGTPVAEALPVTLPSPWDRATLVDTARFRPQLTTAGAGHPVTALRRAAADNLATWRALPELEGVNLVGAPRPGATVLATHPRLRLPSGQPMPVIVAGDYGEGRSLVVTTDTLWRWGLVAAARPGDDGRAYGGFWEGAIRWLIHDPDLRHLQVDTDATSYAPGQPVHVTLRLSGRDYLPLPGGAIELDWRRGADPATAEPVGTATVRTGDDGAATWDVPGLTAGVYRVRGRAIVDGAAVEATDIFLVRETGTELDRPFGDDDLLETVALETGGVAVGPVDELPADLPFDPPRVVRVDDRADVELWSRPGLLVLAILLLGLEWLLRQRSGYL